MKNNGTKISDSPFDFTFPLDDNAMNWKSKVTGHLADIKQMFITLWNNIFDVWKIA